MAEDAPTGGSGISEDMMEAVVDLTNEILTYSQGFVAGRLPDEEESECIGVAIFSCQRAIASMAAVSFEHLSPSERIKKIDEFVAYLSASIRGILLEPGFFNEG